MVQDNLLRKIENWNTKKEENWETVEAVLKALGFERCGGKGSHFTYRHPLLEKAVKDLPDFSRLFSLDGTITIVRKKRKVKGVYLKRILKIAEYLKKLEEHYKGGDK